MADSVLKSYLISLGFATNGGSEFKRSLKDYEKAVVDAEKAIEDARWAGAQTQEEIAKLTRETNLKLAREALAKAADAKKQEDELAKKRKEDAAALIKGFEKLAIAAAAAATAIGYALSKISGAFDNLYFQAERAGTSVQSLKAIGYAFSQTGGSAQQAQASVDSFTTKIRNNPGLRQFVRELGVDDKIQGVDKYIATLDALRKQPKEIGVQYAEMLGISEENYNQFLRQGDAIKAYKTQYDGLLKTFGLDTEKAADNSVKFERAMGKLRATISILAEKLLTALAPAITSIVDRFQTWVEANPGALDKILTNISNAIIAVAEGIAKFIASITGDDGDGFIKKWDAFTARVVRFAETIERIVYGVEKLMKMLHLLSDTKTVLGSSDRTVAALNALSGGTAAPNGPGGANTGNAVPPDDRTVMEKILPKSMGGKDAPAAGDGSRAWRNNNPGNIKMGDLARSMGATEADDKGFAKFPSYDVGRKAQEKLLFEGKNYKDKTIAEAIKTWAPASDGNDPNGYAQLLAKAAGVPVDTPLASLNAEQRGRLLDAQQRKEGWTPGTAESELTTSGPVRANLMNGQYGQPGENLTKLRTQSGLSASVNKASAPSFEGFIKELEGQGYNIKDFGGFNDRNVRGGDRKSQHAYGNAIDLNPGKNPLGTSITDLPDNVRKLAKKYGLIWGMDWKGRKDPMHFEWNGTRPWLEEEKKRGPDGSTPTVPMAGAATKSMTPGGFDPNSIKPSMPAGVGPGATSNSSSTDARSITQHNHYDTKVSGVERPSDHAKAVQSTLNSVNQMSLENAQSAIA